jgi:hypothetical protein
MLSWTWYRVASTKYKVQEDIFNWNRRESIPEDSGLPILIKKNLSLQNPWYVPNTVIRSNLQTPTVKEEIRHYSSQTTEAEETVWTSYTSEHWFNACILVLIIVVY